MAKGEYPYCRSCGQAITEGDTGMGDNAYVHSKVVLDPEGNDYYLKSNSALDDDHDARPDMMHGTLQVKQFGLPSAKNAKEWLGKYGSTYGFR